MGVFPPTHPLPWNLCDEGGGLARELENLCIARKAEVKAKKKAKVCGSNNLLPLFGSGSTYPYYEHTP